MEQNQNGMPTAQPTQGQRPVQQAQRPVQQGQRPVQQGQRPVQQAQGQRPVQQAQRPVQQAQGQRPVQQAQGQRPVQQAQGQRPVQQAQGQRPVQQAQGQRPVQQPQGGVEKQEIVRMYQPDMQVLKATARQLSAMPNVKFGMYGQAGEVLVVAAARAQGMAAATELTENAAEQLEAAMGDSVYGRGKRSLAQVVVDEMLQDEALMIAADEETGKLLEAELTNVKDSDKVFDFGQDSFRSPKMADKILDTAIMDDEESEDPIQRSADRSYAAHKCVRCDYGVAITGLDGGNMVCAAVTVGKTVYIRCIRPAQDAGKTAVYSVLDMIRRIIFGMTVPYARTFRAGDEVDWNDPTPQKAGGAKSSGGKKNLIVPIIAIAALAIALGVGIWYIVTTFIIKDEPSVPAGNSTSISQTVSTPDSAAGAASGLGATSTPASTSVPADSAASVSGADAQGMPSGQDDSVVHPFA